MSDSSGDRAARRMVRRGSVSERGDEALQRRVAWVAKKVGLSADQVMQVLEAAAEAPDHEGSAHSGFLLNDNHYDGPRVLPLWETNWVGSNDEFTKFEVFGYATGADLAPSGGPDR